MPLILYFIQVCSKGLVYYISNCREFNKLQNLKARAIIPVNGAK